MGVDWFVLFVLFVCFVGCFVGCFGWFAFSLFCSDVWLDCIVGGLLIAVIVVIGVKVVAVV